MKGRGFFWYAVLEFQIFWFVKATEALEPGPFFALCICRRRAYDFHLLPPVYGRVAFVATAASFFLCKTYGKRIIGEIGKAVSGIPRALRLPSLG